MWDFGKGGSEGRHGTSRKGFGRTHPPSLGVTEHVAPLLSPGWAGLDTLPRFGGR